MSTIVDAIFRVKRGLAAAWTANDPVLDIGEPGYETDTYKIKYGDGVTPWTALNYTVSGGGGGGGVSDGDYGDITVSGTGTAFTIDNGAVSLAKMANMATASVFYRKTGGSGAPEIQTLATLKTDLGLSGTNSGDQTTISGNAGSATILATGRTLAITGDLAWTSPSFNGSGNVTAAGTIQAGVVTNSKLASMATARFKARVTPGTGDPEDLTGTQATTLLDMFTSALKGLVPASGGGTSNFLRADGGWAVPPGSSGSPGGSTTQVQYNNASAFDGAAKALIDASEHFVADEYIEHIAPSATPSTPAASRVRQFINSVGGQLLTAFLQPDGRYFTYQPHLGRNRVARWQAVGNATTITADGAPAWVAFGTVTTANFASTNVHTQARRVEALATVASTSAIAGFVLASAMWFRGNAAGQGGFSFIDQWGPATGAATSTTRAFCGLSASIGAPTDVEPSTLVDMVGMGWDAADTNIQIMHNDNTGTATKVDLGASFPVPTGVRTKVYELTLYCAPNASEITYTVEDMGTGNKASGTLSSNLPTNTTGLAPRRWMSVGGTSSVIGIAWMQCTLTSEK